MRKPFFISLFLLCSFAESNLLFGQFRGDYEIERHHLDIENFLDWRAYQPPYSWRREWATAQTGMRSSVGSISMEEFYTFNEIRFTSNIGDFTTFHYHQYEESFYHAQPLYQEIEFRFGTDFGASIIGFPPHDKKYGQSGYAVSYGSRFTDNHIRLSMIDQYYYFDEKNKDTEKNDVNEDYLETPLYTRAEIQWVLGDRLFIRADTKQVSKAEFLIIEPEEVRTFQGNEGKLILDWNTSGGNTIGISGYTMTEERSYQPGIATEDQPDMDQKLLLEWTEAYFVLKADENDLLSFGILKSEFLNEIGSDFPVHRYVCHLLTTHLFGIWEKKRSETFSWLFSLQAGEAEIKKDYIGIEEAVDKTNTEIKAGVGVIFLKEGRYRLLGNSTWDLDFFQTRQWDGGNVQLQIMF